MFTLITALLLAQAASAETSTQQPATPPPCASEAHGQFDLWVGEWDVFTSGGDQQVARSSIQRLHNGCAIREQWMPLGGTGGSSLSQLDAETGRWQQLWIDSSGSRVEFEGGLVEGNMVLTGYWADYNEPGVDGLVRMIYSRNGDGSVRQYGQVSFDHGVSWEDSFDLEYRLREE